MKQHKLINTDLSIPTLSLGTMTFGGQTDEAESARIMDYALEQGMTLFDTANIYNGGKSEEIVGRWMKSKREQVTLITKVGYGMGSGLTSVSLKKEAINREFEASLKRLQTDYVDIYYIHAPDNETTIEETLETMTKLVDSGKVGYVGISNFSAWQLADVLATCEKYGFVKPVITQNVYNLISRTLEPELIPFLDKHPMGLTVYNPFAAGLLTGKHINGSPVEGSRLADNIIYNKRYWNEANLNTTQKLYQIANEYKMSMVELSLKWCLSNPKVTSLLCGVSKLEQLEQNVAAIQGNALTKEILEQCDSVWKEHSGNPFKYNR